MNNPKVSFLISAYNEEERIRKCLDSVINQNYPNIEIIIIDDGSIDNTVKVIENYISENSNIEINLIKNEENIGLTESLNKGIEYCSGKYIARLDADDISLSDRVKKQVAFLEKNKDFALVGSFNKKVYSDGKEIINKPMLSPEKIKQNLIHSCQIAHSSMMIRTNILKKYKYNENVATSEDYELYVRLAKDWKIGVIPKVVIVSEIRPESICGRRSKWKRFVGYTHIRWKAYRTLNYPWWYVVYILKGFYDLILPRKISRKINDLRGK